MQVRDAPVVRQARARQRPDGGRRWGQRMRRRYIAPIDMTGRDEMPQREEPLRSIEEVITAFADEWILLRMTGCDEWRSPAAGQVLAHWLDYAVAQDG
jgi:hypothetical protein